MFCFTERYPVPILPPLINKNHLYTIYRVKTSYIRKQQTSLINQMQSFGICMHLKGLFNGAAGGKGSVYLRNKFSVSTVDAARFCLPLSVLIILQVTRSYYNTKLHYVHSHITELLIKTCLVVIRNLNFNCYFRMTKGMKYSVYGKDTFY